jgi:hypothetical protein
MKSVLKQVLAKQNKQTFTIDEINTIIDNLHIDKLLKEEIQSLLDSTPEIQGLKLQSDYWAENDGMLFGPHSIYMEVNHKDNMIPVFLYDEDLEFLDLDEDDEDDAIKLKLYKELQTEPFAGRLKDIVELYSEMLEYYGVDSDWLEMTYGVVK